MDAVAYRLSAGLTQHIMHSRVQARFVLLGLTLLWHQPTGGLGLTDSDLGSQRPAANSATLLSPLAA
jgi:hypothetical protein